MKLNSIFIIKLQFKLNFKQILITEREGRVILEIQMIKIERDLQSFYLQISMIKRMTIQEQKQTLIKRTRSLLLNVKHLGLLILENQYKIQMDMDTGV